MRLPVLMSPGEGMGVAVDLSPAGAGFLLDQVLARGSRVWVTFCRSCRLEVEGEVRWASLAGGRRDFGRTALSTGLQFRGRLSEADLAAFAGIEGIA